MMLGGWGACDYNSKKRTEITSSACAISTGPVTQEVMAISAEDMLGGWGAVRGGGRQDDGHVPPPPAMMVVVSTHEKKYVQGESSVTRVDVYIQTPRSHVCVCVCVCVVRG